ncbi:hypothetical protein [Antarctobacter heliothermus]|uniref:hypothetical protein n=1 Tax=Antarctobacter heliothermus TaxID=74033 RepID=UPI000B8C5D66|nr:hypothetical protein [Antarctobacter heliothermus]
MLQAKGARRCWDEQSEQDFSDARGATLPPNRKLRQIDEIDALRLETNLVAQFADEKAAREPTGPGGWIGDI